MSEKTAKRAEELAAQLKERFGAAVPTSQAAALLLEYAQSLRASSAGAVPAVEIVYGPLASAPTPPAASASADPGDLRGVTLPEGWVPLTIEHEPGYPEEVAFGPKRMMDRLKLWLDRYFAMRLASASAEGGKGVSDDDIRRVFLANGFTIKDGQTDLKPYVFDAAYALLGITAAPNAAGEKGGAA